MRERAQQHLSPSRELLIISVASVIAAVAVSPIYLFCQTAVRSNSPASWVGIHSAAPLVASFNREADQGGSLEAESQRLHRDSRWRGQVLQPFEDPGVNGVAGAESATMTIDDVVGGGLQAIPTDAASAIVIGSVQQGQAFVSPDKTGVYSEFSIVIANVLKSENTQQILAGATVIGIRPGGEIHYPSGHREKFLFRGIGYPKLGAQYVFFLRQDPGGSDYAILTAYELKEGIVFALDSEEPFMHYEGVAQGSFLDFLRRNIAAGESPGAH